MKTKNKAKAHASPTDEPGRLIKAAMKKPGVAELFKVYESWQKFEQVIEVHNQFAGANQIVSISSSSDPVLHHLS